MSKNLTLQAAREAAQRDLESRAAAFLALHGYTGGVTGIGVLAKALLSTLPLEQRRELVLEALEEVAGEVVYRWEDLEEPVRTAFDLGDEQVGLRDSCLWLLYGEPRIRDGRPVQVTQAIDDGQASDLILCLAAARSEKRRREALQ